MPSTARAWLVVLVSLAAAAGAAEKGEAERKPSGLPTWYAQALSRGEAGLNVTHFWSKGPMLRTETVVAGHKIVTIVRGDRYYAYDGLTQQGLAIRREPAAVAADRPDRRPFGREYEILVGQGAERIREETIMGRLTGVYRVTDDRGRRELWVTQDDLHIPLRVEVFERESGAQRVTDYVNWQSDLAMPDAFFEPDAKAALEDMDYSEYLRRTTAEGTVGPVPVFYTNLLYTRKD